METEINKLRDLIEWIQDACYGDIIDEINSQLIEIHDSMKKTLDE